MAGRPSRINGLAEFQRGDLFAAETLCKESLASDPNHAEALNLRGMIAHQRKEYTVAIRFYGKAIAARPDAAGFHNNIGVSLQAMGRPRDAAVAYQCAVSLNPESAQIQRNLGNALRELNEFDGALAALREAIRLRPDMAESHNSVGIILAGMLRWEEAADAYREALRLEPNLADAWKNLGNVLQAIGRTEEAMAAQGKAVAIRPDSAEGHNDLATLLFMAGDRQGALLEFAKATSLRSDFASAWSNLGNVLRSVGRMDEALSAYRQAISVQVDHADAHKNLSIALLLLGEYATGFLEYEWRWKVGEARLRQFPQRRWTGEDPAGKTIFVYEEQGYGDVIQFVRYASMLADRGATVILGCTPALARLVRQCDGVSQVVTAGQRLPPFDLHIPLLSLPLFCRTTNLQSVPAKVPYIGIADDIRCFWEKRLSSVAQRRVGLCWAGNPEHRNNHLRSIPLNLFEPLSLIDGIELHSLQVGPNAADARTSTIRIVDHENELQDFADTAALIDRLDLVITVDTAVAHLAGALGKAVWVLIDSSPDWRWLLERSDSPWYPSARLFRQSAQQPGDWKPVIANVALSLQNRFTPDQRTCVSGEAPSGPCRARHPL